MNESTVINSASNSQPSSNASADLIRAQFHYTYKEQSVILDSQYNYEGSVLAVCNSEGSILFYTAEGEQAPKDPIYTYSCSLTQFKGSSTKETKSKQLIAKQQKNNSVIKICWSLPSLGLFAACSVYKIVYLFKYSNPFKGIELIGNVETNGVPISLSFVPSEVQAILSVGCSDGMIKLFTGDLKDMDSVQGHQEVVNCLSWKKNVLNFDKDQWVKHSIGADESFLSQRSSQKEYFLLTCSSDRSIKLWNLEKGKLRLMFQLQNAHAKHIRQIGWKPVYLPTNQHTVVTCSQDYTVKIWNLKIDNKCTLSMIASTTMKGPVYKADYNDLGNLLAVSFCNEDEQKVETKIYKEINGALSNELKIHN